MQFLYDLVPFSPVQAGVVLSQYHSIYLGMERIFQRPHLCEQRSKFTLPLALRVKIDVGASVPWNEIMAMSLLPMFPAS
jgi:hypothetical protein